jgi:hypothetical protein
MKSRIRHISAEDFSLSARMLLQLFVYTAFIMEALEMERPMTEWNDDRLDELNGRVKDGFASVDKRFEKVDERFVRLEGEMKQGFAKVDKRFERVDEHFVRLEGEMKDGFARVDREIKDGFTQVNERFDRLYYVILVTIVGLAGSLLADNVWG